MNLIKRIYQLSHTTYICQYHLVWATKYRIGYLKSEWVKEEMKRILKLIAKWKKVPIHSWHIGEDHVHLYVTIPPKYSVSYTVEILKGKSSSWIKKKTKKIPKGSMWGRGYFVSTIGLNEIAVKRYIESHGERVKDIQLTLEQA